MNTGAKRRDPFDSFLDTYLQELIAMPDEDILDGTHSANVKTEAMSMLDSARTEAGRRRLAAAREKLSDTRISKPAAVVSAEQAREYVRQAGNDHRYTLAARELNEMSDEDVLRLYDQLKRLEGKGGDDGDSKT